MKDQNPYHFNSFQEYLESPEWRSLSRVAIETAGSRCNVCRAIDNLRVLHLEEPRLYGCEQLGGLIVLCSDCYQTFENLQKENLPDVQDEATKLASCLLRCLRIIRPLGRRPEWDFKLLQAVERKSKHAGALMFLNYVRANRFAKEMLIVTKNPHTYGLVLKPENKAAIAAGCGEIFPNYEIKVAMECEPGWENYK